MSAELETGSLAALRAEDPELGHIVSVCFPKHLQTSILAIASLHLELARIHRVTSEANIGTIRIRWWLDAIDEIFGDSPVRKHPVTLEVAEIAGLSRGLLDAMIEARGQDLDGLRTLSWTEASSLFASQRGNLFRLWLEASGEKSERLHQAANHLGVAFGVWRAAPGLGCINDIPWVHKATAEPDWLIQALTHLDEVDMIDGLPRWMAALSRYLRAGIMLAAKGQTARAVAMQQTAAFGLWRRMVL